MFLRNELPGLLEDIPLMIRSQMYFQHDGAPPHYTRHVRDYLNESFPNRWLGRGGPVACSRLIPDCAVSHVTSPLGILMYSACNPKDNYDMSVSVFVVQFNSFMSLTS